VRLERTRFRSVVTSMLHFVDAAEAPILAKLDSDAVVPPAWLRQSLAVLDRHPELMLLGIEAMNPHGAGLDLNRSYTPAEFISGLGLYRRSAFAGDRPEPFETYYGLEEWQQARPEVVRGWINPAIPLFLLDRLPLEPWATFSSRYVERGWQRPCYVYDPACDLWHWRWPPGTPAVPAVASGATLRLNLGCCDAPLDGYLNVDLIAGPGVEVVDLREPWPWADGSVAHARAWDVIEHLPDKIFTMNELWRILAPGGTAEIALPTTDGPGAFQDPTHVSFWNRRSFLYYEAGNIYRDRFARHYGIRAKFRPLHERTDSSRDGPRLTILLEAVKP
jgi:SAM-dependent methyltransferase